MNRNESPEAKYVREALETGTVQIKLCSALYRYEYIRITDDREYDGNIKDIIDETDRMQGPRQSPKKSHYLQWADRLEHYASWCREKAKHAPQDINEQNGHIAQQPQA
jgi:hypothetical protein